MKKVLIAAAASSVLLLAGCASGPDQATTDALSNLNSKVDQLSADVAAMKSSSDSAAMASKDAKSAAMAAQEEAARANERIDNIAQSYTK